MVSHPPTSSEGVGLYSPEHERDSCGVGFVATIGGSASHRILRLALQAVANLSHRGAVSADGKTGDGAGIQAQVPRRLFARELEALGYAAGAVEDLGVGMAFLPGGNGEETERARRIVDESVRNSGLALLGWRRVPVDVTALGATALASAPQVEQVLVGRNNGYSADEFERKLYLVRRQAERQAADEGIAGLYFPSFSSRTVVYKGLMVAQQLPLFYLDLQDEAFETMLALFHQRYSTNTLPNWFMAQPFRVLAHNGEINTVQGNRNWMRARERDLVSEVWGERIELVRPVVGPGGSDSASLDNVVELLTLSGRDVLHSMMMTVPEAWENMPHMEETRRSFYEYHACLTEPWDGPAALAFTDGRFVGAALDRNGLRPARYTLTADGLVVMGSEAGIVDIDDILVTAKGRLGPGQMIAVDTVDGRLLANDYIKEMVSRRQPYGDWVRGNLHHLDFHKAATRATQPDYRLDTARLRAAFGYTSEELQFVTRVMATDGKEPVGSMGDDTPLAVLAGRPRLLYTYFKQKFAQVTNPPIDPLREELVMSLDTYLGARRSLLEESEEHARLLHLTSPLLTNDEMAALHGGLETFRPAVLRAVFPTAEGVHGLEAAVERLCREAEDAIAGGTSVLVLSDREVGPELAPVPMLVAVGALHHHLIRAGLRMRASIVVETGEARDVHQFACLIGYGASAINPYLAFETIADLVDEGEIRLERAAAVEKYEVAIDAGLLKIMSKMGISTVSAYQGAQIFEAIGLAPEVTERCFAGTPSRLGGVGLREIAADVLARHRRAFGTDDAKLEDGSWYRFRRDGEYHAFNPAVVRALHKSVESGSYDDHVAFRDIVLTRPPTALRDLLAIKEAPEPLPIDEVEPIESIMKRFFASAMSLGALSPEAHAVIAQGMNLIGARSNTGEGGEDPDRLRGDDPRSNKIRQVASARFGVTPAYVANAEILEIKIAQGSKPGEGGQLPAFKVSAYIAAIRHTLPGTPLISPPPHHDIYSIEDLAQLIYDLKQVNPRAKVSVKLVAEEGVGTIAAGVAKAYADIVHIAGHDGGTGASPLSSIKNAGAPWELGLAETQQVLVANDLRGRVTVRADGGLKTGRDVVIAALLGAEEYGFGTMAAVAVGCQMARQCHLNTCPVGVATQREDLRAKFRGTPQHLVNFFAHTAQDIRELLAGMGFRSLGEIVGRTDLLYQATVASERANLLDLSPLLHDPDPAGERPRSRVLERNDRPGEALDARILEDAAEAVGGRTRVKLHYPVTNRDRTIGARVSGEIALRYGNIGLPEATIEVALEGTAGQSLGAFGARGLRIVLTGQANDYVGKGLGGAEIAVRPRGDLGHDVGSNVIVGNTVLYGATAGSLFVAGRAGERFAVRNSGARAVVEGVGDHGCEYMTEGVVVILGPTGRNFGAGMSNGVAYVLDEVSDFPSKVNPELVGLRRIETSEDMQMLLSLVKRHYKLTGSRKAKEILDSWDLYLPLFWRVAPHSALTEEGPMTVVLRHLATVRGHA